jgi:hypothetical protein
MGDKQLQASAQDSTAETQTVWAEVTLNNVRGCETIT